mgnify:CR=1 FL=1
MKEPIVFKTAEIRAKVESYLNDLELSDILQTCEFLGYLDGIHDAGGINKRGYEFYHNRAMERFKSLEWLMIQNSENKEFVELSETFNQPEEKE